MKRIVLGFLVAVLGIASVVGIAAAGSGASPSPQEAETVTVQGWMGVHIADINQRIQDHFDLTVDSGVVVINVAAGSPADEAGVEPGNVILTINGDVVESAEQVVDAVRAQSPGTVVVLTVLRGVEELTLEVTLAERPLRAAHQGFGRGGFQLPSYLRGLLGRGLPGNLLHSEHQVLGPDGETITVEITYGTVQSVTETGLTIVRKDDLVVGFETTDETRVIVSGRPINLSGLKEDSPVLVVQRDGSVILVLGWPGDLMGKHRVRGHRYGRGDTRLGQSGFVQPGQLRALPFGSDELQTRLRGALPNTELFDRITGALEQVRERSSRLAGPQLDLDRISEALEQARERADNLAVPQNETGQGQTL